MTPPDLASPRGALDRNRFLEAVLASAVDYAIIALDLDGLVVEWTEGARRILGWTADEMIGRHCSTFFSPEDVAVGIPEAEMRGARDQGRASDERWHMHSDGTRFYALGEMMPLRDEAGTLVGYLKILRDRTSQRLAEEALRDREAFLSSVLASSGDCIKVLDTSGRLTFMTDTGQKVMEVGDFAKLCGLFWPTLWESAGREAAEVAIAEAREGGVGRFQGFCPTLKGTPKHWDVVVTPIRGTDGRVVNLLAVSRDITAIMEAEAARDVAETKARFDEGLLRTILDAAPIGISVTDARTGDAILLNDTLEKMLGQLQRDGSTDRYASYGAEHRDGRPYARTDYPSVRVLNSGETVGWEDMLYRRPGDARLQVFEATSAPVRDAGGALVASVTILKDVGAERATKAEADRLGDVVAQSGDMICIADLSGAIEYVNPAGLALLGFASLAPARGAAIDSLFAPESRDILRCEAHPRVRDGNFWQGKLVLRTPSGGDLPVHHSILPVRDATGAIVNYSTVTRDRSVQQAEEERRSLLAHELSHRMKNMLAMVQAIAFQTLRSAPDLAAARDTLSARIVAMSKAHDLLLEDSGDSADVRAVVAAAVAPHDELKPPFRFTLEGPILPVGPRAAMALSLMLHELATNAAKYGALSVPAGRVAISWEILGDLFTLRWREHGGPAVVRPTRTGFGSRLIQRGLAADVGGKVTLAYPPEGVTCEMLAAVAGLQAGR